MFKNKLIPSFIDNDDAAGRGGPCHHTHESVTSGLLQLHDTLQCCQCQSLEVHGQVNARRVAAILFVEYCLLCTAGRGTLDVEDVEDVEDVADVEDVKDV